MLSRGLATAIAALAALAVAACERPCPAVVVRSGGQPRVLPWVGGAASTVEATVGGRTLHLRLDTGTARSALALGATQGVDLTAAEIELGALTAGPVSLNVLAELPAADGVLGADVLHRVAWAMSARARHTIVDPQDVEGDDAVVTAVTLDHCAAEREPRVVAPLLLVAARVEGREVTLVLDTGAAVTSLHSSVLAGLADRPRLSGIPVWTGFAGWFDSLAVRVAELETSAAASRSTPVLLAPELDAELERLNAALGHPSRCDPAARCAGPVIAGFLGWSFLREHRVAFLPASAERPSTLRLHRFDTQDHWRRDFVGLGVVTHPVTEPPGLRVEAFLSVSPARDAGIRTGDVLTAVDDQPLTTVLPRREAGTRVRLDLVRQGASREVTAEYRDLLPTP